MIGYCGHESLLSGFLLASLSTSSFLRIFANHIGNGANTAERRILNVEKDVEYRERTVFFSQCVLNRKLHLSSSFYGIVADRSFLQYFIHIHELLQCNVQIWSWNKNFRWKVLFLFLLTVNCA